MNSTEDESNGQDDKSESEEKKADSNDIIEDEGEKLVLDDILGKDEARLEREKREAKLNQNSQKSHEPAPHLGNPEQDEDLREELDFRSVDDWEEKRDSIVESSIEEDHPNSIIEESKSLDEDYFIRVGMLESNQYLAENFYDFVRYFAHEWSEVHYTDLRPDQTTRPGILYVAIETQNNLSYLDDNDYSEYSAEMDTVNQLIDFLADFHYQDQFEFKRAADAVVKKLNDLEKRIDHQ